MKKEATLESCKSRTINLERRIKKFAELFVECHDSAVRSDLHVTHPALFTHLRELKSHLAPEIEELGRTETNSPKTITSEHPDERVPQGCRKSNDSYNAQPATSFGYQVSNTKEFDVNGFDEVPAEQDTQRQSYTAESHSSPGPAREGRFERSYLLDPQYVDRPFGGSIPITYSFHETMFSRRLHRYSLEHAYRLFIDSRSDPIVTYQMFRLVACMRDKNKMLPYFQKLLRAGVEDALEIPTLPFYCIGGAGAHYPHKDHSGTLSYPLNMRLPRRILGIFPGAKTSRETNSLDTQSHLKIFGFDGDWFDCQDVQGYLEENGVILDHSSTVAKIHTPAFHQSTGVGEHISLDKRQRSIRNPSATSNGYGYGSHGDEGGAADNTSFGRDPLFSFP